MCALSQFLLLDQTYYITMETLAPCLWRGPTILYPKTLIWITSETVKMARSCGIVSAFGFMGREIESRQATVLQLQNRTPNIINKSHVDKFHFDTNLFVQNSTIKCTLHPLPPKNSIDWFILKIWHPQTQGKTKLTSLSIVCFATNNT
jgi:hypothetical protein